MTRPAALDVLEPLAALLVTVAGALSFGAFYTGWWWLVVIGGAIVLGGLTAGLSAVWRVPWWATVPTGLVLLAVALVEAAYPGLTDGGVPTVDAFAALGTGVVTGAAKMLTIGLPADITGDLLVVPAILGWVAGGAAVVLSARTSSVAAPAALPLVLFLGGVIGTASRKTDRLLLTGVIVLAVLLLLMLRSNRIGGAGREGIDDTDAEAVGVDLRSRRRRSAMTRIAFGLPAVAGATALAVLAGWLLPIADGSHRADPRALRTPSFQLTETLSPLVEVRPQLTGPRTKLFTVAITNLSGGAYRPDRVRTAALTSYDGALWTGPSAFDIAGTTLPGFVPLATPTQQVRLDVDVTGLLQPFLPVIGEPVTFTAPARGVVAFDRSTSTVVSTSTAGPLRYTMVSEVRPQDTAARQALLSRTPDDVAHTALPAPPAWVRELATLAIGNRDTPMSQLLALEDYLRKQNYSATALPGHSYGSLKRVLLGVSTERVGNAEHYAAAFAVLARVSGFPARVAVGYQLRQENRDGDRYTVYSSDAHAWPEVRLDGYGWVAFEPTDARSPVAPQPPRAPDLTLGAADQDQVITDPRRLGSAEITPSVVAARVGIGVAVAIGVVVLLGVLIAVLKAMRRRRRARVGTAADRIVAAWADVVDQLRDAGMRVPVSSTAAEVAVRARQTAAAVAATASISALAPVVTTAVYSFWEPTEDQATWAWDLAAQARTQIARSLSLGVRLRALVDPRTLLPGRERRQGSVGAVGEPVAVRRSP